MTVHAFTSSHGPANAGGCVPVYPAGPFRRWLAALERTGRLPTTLCAGRVGQTHWAAVSEIIRLSRRNLLALRQDQRQLVAVDVVDRAVLAWPGVLLEARPIWRLEDLYPGVPADINLARGWRRWPTGEPTERAA
jgi:hypothetical protein